MSNTNNKTSLEEAKLSFSEIERFAKEQAAAQLEEQVAEKLKHIFEEKLMKEDITITISGDDVNVSKDGEALGGSLGLDSEMGSEIGGSLEPEISSSPEVGFGDERENEEEFMVSDDEDEIAIDSIGDNIQNENMEEMNKMTMEDATAAAPAPAPMAPATDAAPATDVAMDPNAAPVEDGAASMPELLSKLDTLINVLMQKEAPAADPAAAGTEQEFDVIDDEAGAPPAAAPAAAAPAPGAPMQEEEIEITDFDDKNFIDEMEDQMLEIVDEDNMPMEGAPVEETRSLGFTSKRTGDKALKMGAMADEKGHHAPVTSLKEGKIKAQYESKIDELIKENNSLKNSVKSLNKDVKEFEDAFVGLRTQFNEMQLFNGKLALVNKVLMNGGMTTDEKIKICEQFDSVKTYEEASKLFKSIIKENNIKVGDAKLRGASTNTVKPKSTTEPLYESVESRRAKVLAGLIKAEDTE